MSDEQTIDLAPFCGSDPYRPYLHRPFRIDGWTYATNGCIAVRTQLPVPADPAPSERIGNLPAAFDGARTDALRPLPPLDLECGPKKLLECRECGGSGNEHDCPRCTCKCPHCGGAGVCPDTRQEQMSIGIGEAIFDATYIRLIAALPQPQIETRPVPYSPLREAPRAPMFFTFRGGEGVLMPRKRKFRRHVVVPPVAETGE